MDLLHTSGFTELLKSVNAKPSEWSEPEEFDLSSRAARVEVQQRLQDGRISHTIDRSTEIANDLFDMKNPDKKFDDDSRQEFVRDIEAQGVSFGRWFNFAWDNSLIRYPEQADYQNLRTFRNQDIVTSEEQKTLRKPKVAVLGMSVGSSVVEQLILAGIGDTLILGDYDTLDPTNLNRIKAHMGQVGMKKIDIMAQKISLADPYVHQVHFREGITPETFDQLEDLNPEIIFDEVDDLAVKALLRVFAAKHGIPLIMASDVADRSVIDVERYDDGKTQLFNGRLKTDEIEKLVVGSFTDSERLKLTVKIIGFRNLSPRLLQSSMNINKTLGGLPQLGSTASSGGALAAVAAREILLGRKMHSGRYISVPKSILKLQNQTSFKDSISIVKKFVKR